MTEKCESCKACRANIEYLEEFEETDVNFPKIASYLNGTITEKEGEYEIHFGRERTGIKISGRDAEGLIGVAVMRSKKLFKSYHLIWGIEKVRFSTVLAPRGKTRKEIKTVSLFNEKGGIIISKEGDRYDVVSIINMREEQN